MSEKRRPDKIIVAEKQGKKGKIRYRTELFSQVQFGDAPSGNLRVPRYRIRLNGKWVTSQRYWTLTEVTSQLRRWLVK